MIERTFFAVSTDETRYNLNGVYFEPAADALRLVATDGHRLSLVERKVGATFRYGNFYGPGTGIEPGGELLEAVRRRRFPLIGSGAGIWSFVHVDGRARRARPLQHRGR